MKILCPFCFNEYPESAINYMCISTVCDNNKTNTPIAGARPNKNGICTCNACGKTTSRKSCPQCGEVLPDNILESQTKVISIIGGKGCGKSYFVATLLKQVMEKSILARHSGISVKWGYKSRERYNDRFKKDLDNFRPLPGTQNYANIIKDYPPILVELDQQTTAGIFKRPVVNSYTYSFFDAAGECFEKEDVLIQVIPYLQHSEALVFILDPMQVEGIRNHVQQKHASLPTPTDADWTTIVNTTLDVVKRERNIRGQIDIPVCICVSKWDLLLDLDGLVPPGLSVSRMDTMRSGYNENAVETASDEIRSLLTDWDFNLVNTVENACADVTYFAFSAWGSHGNDPLAAPAIASYRVEDPYLWILHRNKML